MKMTPAEFAQIYDRVIRPDIAAVQQPTKKKVKKQTK